MQLRYQLIIVVSLFFMQACGDGRKPITSEGVSGAFKDTTIELIDSLGLVQLAIPRIYDTFFIWTHFSDCGKPCDIEKYRFQPRSVPIFKESGFYYTERVNSKNQFTISHSGYLDFHDDADLSDIISFHHISKINLVNDFPSIRLKFDTIELINDRYFSIISGDLVDPSKSIFYRKVIAATTIKSNFIKFTFELLTTRKDSVFNNYIENAIIGIRSIRLSQGI